MMFRQPAARLGKRRKRCPLPRRTPRTATGRSVARGAAFGPPPTAWGHCRTSTAAACSGPPSGLWGVRRKLHRLLPRTRGARPAVRTVPHAYAPGTPGGRNLRNNTRYIAPNQGSLDLPCDRTREQLHDSEEFEAYRELGEAAAAAGKECEPPMRCPVTPGRGSPPVPRQLSNASVT
jgi:hypothetical protein